MADLPGDILLDAGTNELEVLVFGLSGGWYGVNVAKVREVIRKQPTASAPHQHPSVIGMFSIRGSVLPVVDLAKHLELRARDGVGTTSDQRDLQRVIIMEFNRGRCGFLVDSVEQIHRMSWAKVRPAPDVNLMPGRAGAAPRLASATTGIIDIMQRLVQMIDFESVADSITSQDKLRVSAVENDLRVDRAGKRVVVAEDSPFMRTLIRQAFEASGYARIEVYGDGEAAWNGLSDSSRGPVAAVVSDIEMPRVDGLHLTKRIRENQATRSVPVLLFSSLISEDNRKKGEQVGATAQLAKPELAEIVRMVDRIVSGQPLNAAPMSVAA
jgi:two-component system, chemotaxis family, chemotaxis protein CheV